ncbi:GMP synthase [Akanthomyces lecanii RCEF 1005]|uniref:GMP synthase n=1 Tax=Akanthomyces lecanii RCEF 1005 TaxID=1081108 RepID=A0A167THW2_CORDF|nr:GMP synthase [Akanthomyces lecanii RCEF 1005]
MTKFRLAVLECDVPCPGVVEFRGSYGDMFHTLLAEGMRRLPGDDAQTELEVTKWDVVNAHIYPDFDDFDGLMISGSKHTAFDNTPWITALIEYLSEFLKASRKPIVGICFGHQIIARTLGGRVQMNPDGWENSVTKIHLSATGRHFFGVPDIFIHQTHRDAVMVLPIGVDSIGGSLRCGVQGMYKAGRILSLQGHPEFDKEAMTLILKERNSIGLLSAELYNDAMSRVDWPHCGEMLATKICEFLLEAKRAT